ncbi:uncharacterized protein si:dkey-229b18.3 [Hippocampus zosterae]|uniref:uncharacterized protein si:dkey-229b18.3 n=1 Tax=Hippocampus zosterae TaxID=109293 RepID=UPI00223CB9E5|nr:uncharacterized protein si:dkey-229b18.3 [Hippocampus zosterae]XP_051938706.1 uncharacterized protein si:dkey-229b18.3 [Hippocampus zosterae]XP_051938707.1 uncharacterized protein si:dkey-229b18.3 [Hippocampus zosterae]
MAVKGTRCPPKPWSSVAGERSWSPNFEWIGGLLYRKKLERGFLNYREVLDEDRRLEAVATFHRRPPGMRHLSLEETYKCVAENYWWEGMYFHIRDFVLDCSECQSQQHKVTEELGSRGCVTKTIASHGSDMLNKLRSQREAGMFCDITVRTNGQSYAAHRAVLAAVSDHFQEVFTEMDSSMKTDIDLTGFSEDSLLSLLDFSYSSTLCVRWVDLPEVITMARHLGMWPAVEACSALMKEHRNIVHPTQDVKLEYGGVCSRRHHQKTEPKRKRKLEDNTGGVHLTVDTSDESVEGSPCCNLHKMSNAKVHNRLPMSPSHRMKLMDFKSPSSKKTAVSTNIATPQSKNYSPISPPNTRLLRSSPGAAQQVQRLLPILESPRQNRKSCTPRSSPVCSPVRVKQEVEEVGVDEEDYARAQEKYKLMLVLGLQRTALLPRPEDLIGWRQKKRLRKLKANNYSLTKRRKPRSAPPVLPYTPVTLSLPLCDPVNSILLDKEGKTKSRGPPVNEGITKRHNSKKHVPPSDRSMRSKGVLPDMFRAASRPGFSGRELRRSVRNSARVHPPVQQPVRRTSNKTPVRNTVRIKPEPAEYSVSGLSLASVNHSSPRTRARNNITGAAVKTLRYNSSRPGTKAKARQGSTREERKPRGRPRKVLREEMDTERQAKGDQHDGFQFSEHSPPQAIYNHPLYKVIKEEPPDPVPVGGPLLDPPSPDLGKRQSKPPIKLLDSGFLFSFCRPSGAPMVGIKKEEESVDICLTRSVSQIGEKFGTGQSKHRALRARGPPHTLTMVKREREERSVSQSRVQRRRTNSRNDTPLVRSKGKKAALIIPKQEPIAIPLSSRGCVVLDSVRRARLKQLRGPRSQVPKAPKVAHSCTQCSTSYKDCDALIMHRLRHIAGKHWPCLLCSKTFFRLRNVRNHIRTHDPKLYKCRNCIVAGS